MLWAVLLLGQLSAEQAVDHARELTRAEVPCEKPADKDEVVVCALRRADRLRVPFVPILAEDRVPFETERLLKKQMPDCGTVSAFFADCGMVGVTASVGGNGASVKPRTPAP